MVDHLYRNTFGYSKRIMFSEAAGRDDVPLSKFSFELRLVSVKWLLLPTNSLALLNTSAKANTISSCESCMYVHLYVQWMNEHSLESLRFLLYRRTWNYTVDFMEPFMYVLELHKQKPTSQSSDDTSEDTLWRIYGSRLPDRPEHKGHGHLRCRSN